MQKLTIILLILSTFNLHAEEISQELQKKLDIIIPKFKVENKSFEDVISSLRRLSAMNDPKKTGLNIIYLKGKKNAKDQKAIKAFEKDPFAEGDPFGDLDDVKIEAVDISPKFNFDFERMPVKECLRYISIASQAKYRIDKNAVVVAAAGTPLKVNELSSNRVVSKIKSAEYKIDLLRREIDLLKKLKALPKEKGQVKNTLKENVIFPKIRFENATLSQLAEYIEKQSSYFTKDNKGISVAIYIPADVKLKKVSIEANNMSVLDLANYSAEQLGIKCGVENNEITFREAEKLKLKTETYTLTWQEFKLLAGSSLDDLKSSLQKYGLTFPENSDLKINSLRKIVTLTNTVNNHTKFKKILELIEDK